MTLFFHVTWWRHSLKVGRVSVNFSAQLSTYNLFLQTDRFLCACALLQLLLHQHTFRRTSLVEREIHALHVRNDVINSGAPEQVSHCQAQTVHVSLTRKYTTVFFSGLPSWSSPHNDNINRGYWRHQWRHVLRAHAVIFIILRARYDEIKDCISWL